MNELDLDINNYTIKDLEKFFSLTKKKYSADDVELKEYQLREQLLNSGHVDKHFKTDLVHFLTKAKEYIIYVKCSPDKKPTSIPKNYKLDKLEYEQPPENSLSRKNDLIQHEQKNFIYTAPTSFLPGKVNQIDTRIITKCLNIDSKFRKDLHKTDSSDFLIHMPSKFHKVVSMELSAIELPLSYFGISGLNHNNFIYMKIYFIDKNGSQDLLNCENIFNIPDGQYSVNDLIDIINLMFQREPNVFSCMSLKLEYDENNKGSQKVCIYANSNNQYDVKEFVLDFSKSELGEVDNKEIYSKIGWNLGFKKHIYCGKTIYFSDTKIEATHKYMYLAIDDFNNSSNDLFVSVFEESILQSDILARISLKGTLLNSVTENNYQIISEPRKYFGPVDIQRIRVRLLDEFGRTIPMHSLNYSFCLTLKILYDQ